MKNILILILIFVLFYTNVQAQGRLQNADFIDEATLLGAGGSINQLLNDSKIYVTSVAKTLDDAIVDGDIAPNIDAKGDLLGNNGTSTVSCATGGNEGDLLTKRAADTCGFSFQAPPVSTTLTQKGEIQGFDGVNNVAIPPATADNQFLVSKSSEASGNVWSDSITGLISQAQFVGDLLYQDAASQVFEIDQTTIGVLTHTGAGYIPTIRGDLAVNDSTKAAFTILNARTDGYYRVELQAFLYNQTNSALCSFALSESTSSFTGSPILQTQQAPNSREQNFVSANFKFNTEGDKTINLIGSTGVAGNDCEFISGALNSAQMTVYFYPDSNSLAAIQNKELTAETSNSLSAIVDATGAILSEDYDFINGNCALNTPSTDDIRCTFNSSIFTENPSCSVISTDRSNRIAIQTELTTSQITWQTERVDLGTKIAPTVEQYTIHCNKQGADVNKSQVITGTFDGINSSDIVSVVGRGNSGGALTANVTKIDFTEVTDNQNTWDGSSFTAPKDGIYFISGYVDYTANVTQIVYIWKNGVQDIAIGRNSSAISDTPLSGTIKLVAGDVIDFRINGSATLNNDPRHNISITQSADYEAIVKNLYNDKTECQTKVLASNVTSFGNISGLTFNNLDIGKTYSFTAFHDFNVTSSDTFFQVRYTSDGGSSYFCVGTQGTNASYRVSSSCPQRSFIATSSTLTANANGFDNVTLLSGTTWAQLCELPESTILNSNKWD